MDNSDEDTNGSFEFVDKVTDSSDSDCKSSDEKAKSSTGDDKEAEDKWEDVLGSGNLMKKVIKKGGDIRPERRDFVEIKYECRYEGDTIEVVDYLKVSISDCELIQGLDLIVPLMHVGEVAEVKVSPRFAYGSKGVEDDKLHVPPDATLHYIVELISTSPEPELETMSVDERKEIGLRKKLRGNWWFSREDYSFAILCYKRALEYLNYTEHDGIGESMSRTEADQLIDERINVLNNLSMAQLKVESLDDALTSADIVLKLQPNNVKALFRKGKALADKGDRREALSCLKKASDIDPGHKSLQIEVQKLQNLLAVDAKMERTLYKKMFEPSKSNKELNHSSVKNTWIKLGIFIGSLAVAVVGVIVYKYQYVD